jgi:hypothetical protein
VEKEMHMMAATCVTVVGVFDRRPQAERAIEDLGKAGFSSSQIGLMARDQKEKTVAKQVGEAESNAEIGGIAGALAGAGVGGLVGLGVLAGVIPVIGPAIAAGTLATILSNAAGGAALAGLSGALIGWGVPEEHAKYYERQLNAGRVIVSVTTSDRFEVARTILERHGAHNHQLQPKGER